MVPQLPSPTILLKVLPPVSVSLPARPQMWVLLVSVLRLTVSFPLVPIQMSVPMAYAALAESASTTMVAASTFLFTDIRRALCNNMRDGSFR